jgi:hypothetical protein
MADVCPICLEEFGERNIFVTACGHKFCGTCVLRNQRWSRRCAVCRAVLVEDESAHGERVGELGREEEWPMRVADTIARWSAFVGNDWSLAERLYNTLYTNLVLRYRNTGIIGMRLPRWGELNPAMRGRLEAMVVNDYVGFATVLLRSEEEEGREEPGREEPGREEESGRGEEPGREEESGRGEEPGREEPGREEPGREEESGRGEEPGREEEGGRFDRLFELYNSTETQRFVGSGYTQATIV